MKLFQVNISTEVTSHRNKASGIHKLTGFERPRLVREVQRIKKRDAVIGELN